MATVVSVVSVVIGLASATAASGKPVRSDSIGAPERGAVGRVTPRPPAVSGLNAFQDGVKVTVGWTAPRSHAYDRIVVRYLAGSRAPRNPTQGRRVVERSPNATTAVLRHLPRSTAYAVSVWTQLGKRLSARRTTRFTTLGPRTSPQAVVSGSVTDDQHAPLSGVAVLAMNYITGAMTSTVSDATGRYRIRVPAGTDYLEFFGDNASGGDSDATGYVGGFKVLSTLAGQRVEVDDALRPGAALTGKVTDDAGDPVAGVRVLPEQVPSYVQPDIGNAFISFGYTDGPAVRTAVDGSYLIKGLPRMAALVCYRPGTARTAGGQLLVGRCGDQTVVLTPGATASLNPVALTARTVRRTGGAIAGIVRDDRGFPVRDADVYVIGEGRSGTFGFGTTGRDGRYRLTDLAPGKYQLCVDPSFATDAHEPYGNASTCRSTAVVVTRGAVTRVRTTLPRAAAASGVVRAVGGAPVSGAQVSVFNRRSGVTAMTDAAGRWVAPGLNTGRYRSCADTAFAHAANHPQGVSGRCYAHGEKFTLRQGAARLGVDYRLAAAGAIAGTVSTPGPQQYLAIWARRVGSGGTSDSSEFGRGGRYRINGLRPGRYRICYQRLNFMTDTFRIKCEPNATRVHAGQLTRVPRIDLPTGGRIDVTVRDQNGNPVAGADALALLPCTRECDTVPSFDPTTAVRVRASWTTGPAGHVSLAGLPDGEYAVCAFAYLAATATDTPNTGYADTCASNVFNIDVQPGAVATVPITLGTGGMVTGLVTDLSGHPLRGVHVHISGSAAQDTVGLGEGPTPATLAAVTGPDGSYAVRSIAAGDQTVCFTAPHAKGGTGTHGYEKQCIGGQPGGSTGTPVTVTAGSITSGADIALTPNS